MRRVYIPPAELVEGELELADDARRYVSRVLRLRVDELIELFDGQGRHALARLTEVGRRRVRCLVEVPRPDPPPDLPALHLGLPLIKGERLDLAVRMLTEIGVASITLLICERSVRRAEGAGQERQERLERVAQAAARQSGRSRLPEIGGPQPLADFALAARGLKLFGETVLPGVPSITTALAIPEPPEQVCICVGPEGGLTADERATLLEQGFTAASLGPHVLRAETAAVAAASAAQACLSSGS